MQEPDDTNLYGGENLLNNENLSNDENYNYFNSILNSFLEQNLDNESNESNEVINLNDKPLKINKDRKSGYFNKASKVGIYTKSFGKESMLLFIDWINNVIKDTNNDIYVVAHSNIMQSALYSICEKKYNKIIKKKNVNDCHEGLYDIVKKENIWELILSVSDNSINSVKIRKGQQKPNNNSKKNLNYNKEKELSCGKDITKIISELDKPKPVKEFNKHKPIILQGEKIEQPSEQLPEQPPRGFFQKVKHFFTKKRGGKYNSKKYNLKKYTFKRNIKKYNSKKNTKKCTCKKYNCKKHTCKK